MPPSQRRQAPGSTASFDSTPAGSGSSSYKILKPEYDGAIDIMKPSWDNNSKPVTVFRPYPCPAYEGMEGDFAPYRIDQNRFGFWFIRVHAADRIGNPTTTFCLQSPWAGFFDWRVSPLGVLFRAVDTAIKRGQGKLNWESSTRPGSYQPSAQELLTWDGMTSGGSGRKAQLSRPTELFLMQGLVMQHNNQPTFKDGKQPPGWGKPCIFMLTRDTGNKLMEALNAETENYRGDPENFEARYVNGDPVDINGGRYMYFYPVGGDPRNATTQLAYDPLSMPTGGRYGKGHSQGSGEREAIGFECHLEKTYKPSPVAQPMPAALNTPDRLAVVKNMWRYWEDILWVPTPVEQVQLLANCLPISMIDYAFSVEHPEWISPEVRAKIEASRSASIPEFPTTPSRSTSANPFAAPPGWNQPTQPTAPPSPPAKDNGLVPFPDASMTMSMIAGFPSDVTDEALPPLPTAPTNFSDFLSSPTAGSSAMIDSAIASAAAAFGSDASQLPQDPTPAAPPASSAAALAAKRRTPGVSQ